MYIDADILAGYRKSFFRRRTIAGKKIVNSRTMRKRMQLLALFMVFALMGRAQSLAEVWKSMPDSLSPTLSSASRAELLEASVSDSTATVKNLLDGISRIDSLRNGVLSVAVSESYHQQLCLLPTLSGDTLVGFVETYLAPEPDSRLTFYNRKWEMQGALQVQKSWLLQHPDTLTEADYQRALLLTEPLMVGMTLENGGRQVRLKLSGTLLSADDRKRLHAITRDAVLRWDGQTYVP